MPIRRVRRPEAEQKTIDELTNEDGGVFATQKDVLIFAACVGFSRNKRAAFNRTGEPIRWELFDESGARPLVNAIAFVETGDAGMLAGDDVTFDKKLTIFEEYANGGLGILREQVLERAGSNLDNLVNMINDEWKREEPKRERDALSQIMREY